MKRKKINPLVADMLRIEKENAKRWKDMQKAVKQVQEDVDYPTRADYFPEEYEWEGE